jgi:hypothetical protein
MKHNSTINSYTMKALKITVALCLSLAVFSCNKDEAELDKGETPLELTVSTPNAVLEHRLSPNQALAFEWTGGTNRGTGAAIRYTFQMDVKGNDFRGGINEKLGKVASRLRNFTHKQLNDTIAICFPSLPTGEETEFEARILAEVAAEGVETQISNTVTFRITTYGVLYMVGDAAPNGWSKDNATGIGTVVGNPGRYSWSGYLNAGDLKFLVSVSTGSWIPSYNRGADDRTLVYRDSDDDPDNKFIIPVPGEYTIDLDIPNLTIAITAKVAMLAIVGSATPGGWSLDHASIMTPGQTDGEYIWTGMFHAGELKFITTRNDDYLPSYNRGADDHTLVYRDSDDDPDNKFVISEAGEYRVTLNIRTLTIAITRTGDFRAFEQLWMIGDATPGQWSWDNVTAMTKDPGSEDFIYDGPLTAGEFKCPIEIKHDWSGRFLMPLTNHPPLTETSWQIVQGGIDYKWQITEPGNYRVVVNRQNKTIHITKK